VSSNPVLVPTGRERHALSNAALARGTTQRRRMNTVLGYARFAWLASVMTVAAIASSATVLANDSSRDFGAVICTSEAGGPWTVRARGTLTRTKSKNELIYELNAGEHSFAWRFVTTAQGSTTGISPGFLIDRFARQPPISEESPQLPRGPINAAESAGVVGRTQSLHATGEIREYGPSNALMLVIGSKCPAGRASRPNSTRGG
jgi:hypothetical protein